MSEKGCSPGVSIFNLFSITFSLPESVLPRNTCRPIQWSLHFKTVHFARKVSRIEGGLNMENVRYLYGINDESVNNGYRPS